MFQRLDRWLYRGNRPHWLASVLNNGWAMLANCGLTPRFVVTLEVVGRASGRTIAFPVVLATVGGHAYVVSMLGEHVQWVRNVRAAGGQVTLCHGRRRAVQLAEVPPDQRAPILKAYLQRAPGARPHFLVRQDAPLAAFEQIATHYPVFLVS